MLRASAIVLLLAVLALTATSIAWLRSTAPLRVELRDDPNVVLSDFERSRSPVHTIDLAARQAGRTDLIDPRFVLPTWHLHPRKQAAAVFVATRQCPPEPLAIEVDDAALSKAYEWHAQTCAPGAVSPAPFVDEPPFLHPSGHSYAALAAARHDVPPSFAAAHARSFHVLELAALEPTQLDDDSRSLRSLGPRAWDAIAHGDRLVLSASFLVFVDHGPLGVARLRLYDRRDWERAERTASLALAPRLSAVTCARPASGALCWQAMSPIDRHRDALVLSSSISAGTAVIAGIGLAIAYLRERRRIHADRIHVLRMLTHELRTPAMSLGIDIEPLRAAYDELPASCQEPLLRISDGIARLGRVLHRSAKYMALFEAKTRGDQLVGVRSLPSVREWMTELTGDWQEGVVLRTESEDGAIQTDPEWLAVALRNLVENAYRHGKPPVGVTWRLERDDLVVRVADAGASPSLSLRRAVTPYHRGPASKGLGLGLAIVDRVARLLGGKLTHEPSPTVFQLRIPRRSSKEVSS